MRGAVATGRVRWPPRAVRVWDALNPFRTANSCFCSLGHPVVGGIPLHVPKGDIPSFSLLPLPPFPVHLSLFVQLEHFPGFSPCLISTPLTPSHQATVPAAIQTRSPVLDSSIPPEPHQLPSASLPSSSRASSTFPQDFPAPLPCRSCGRG